MRALKDAGWTEARRHVARGALPRRRLRVRRQDQHARARDELHHRAARVRRDAQSVGPRAQHRRIERRRGGRGRRGARAGRARQRHGRLDPLPGVDVRHRRPRSRRRARTTLGPDFGEYWGPLTHEFVLTRSVRDTAAVLDAVAGAGPATRTPRRRRCARTAKRSARPSERLRIGFRTTPARRGSRRTPTASPRSRRPRACSRRSATTSTRSTFRALDAPIDDAFGIGDDASRSRATSRAGRRGSVATSRPELEPMNAMIASGVRRDHRGAVRRRARRHADVVARGVGVVGRRRRARAADEPGAAGPARRARARQPREPRPDGRPRRRSPRRSTSPASPRSRCRCTGTTTASRSACSSSRATAAKTCCSASPRSSRRRVRGPTAHRPCSPDAGRVALGAAQLKIEARAQIMTTNPITM